MRPPENRRAPVASPATDAQENKRTRIFPLHGRPVNRPPLAALLETKRALARAGAELHQSAKGGHARSRPRFLAEREVQAFNRIIQRRIEQGAA